MGLHYGKFIKVPYHLTEQQRKKRVDSSVKLLKVLKKAKKHNYCSLLTLDETPIQLQNEENQGWYSADKPTPCYEAESLRKKKFTLTLVWGTGGVAVVDGCDGALRIDSNHFCQKTIGPAIEWCKNKRKIGGAESFVFHMDNAPCHNSSVTKQFLEDNNITRVEHPPYSPDLAPCDFYMFGYIKNHFARTIFKDKEDAIEQITRFVNSIPKKQQIAAFDEWMKRLEKCIQLKGRYVFLPSKVSSGERERASNELPSIEEG